MRVCVRMCMHVGTISVVISQQLCIFCYCLLCFRTGPLTGPELTNLVRLADDRAQRSGPPSSQPWGYQHILPHWAFPRGIWGGNLGPCACMQANLLTGLSPRSLNLISFALKDNIFLGLKCVDLGWGGVSFF